MNPAGCCLSLAIAASASIVTLGAASPPAAGSYPASPRPSLSVSAARVAISPDFPDPAVMTVGDTYYAYGTAPFQAIERNDAVHVQVASSQDLKEWTIRGDAVPDLPSWALDRRDRVWAPSVAQVGRSSFVLAVTLPDGLTRRQCIGIGRATSPLGPFRLDDHKPVICQPDLGGSIDPSFQEHGKTWIVWKSDGNAVSRPSQLWVQRISPSSLGVVGEPSALLVNARPWHNTPGVPERSTIEGPALARIRGKLLLLYSANGYATPEYAMGFASCKTVEGPCRDQSPQPFLSSGEGLMGPGGGSPFRDIRDRWWIAFHGWVPAIGYESGGGRPMFLARLRLSDSE